METNDHELEEQILEALRSDQKQKPKRPGKREAFLLRNQCWIGFLNDFASGELAKVDKITQTWRKLDGTIDHEMELDITKSTEDFKNWQGQNLILDVDKSNGNRISGYRFASEKEVMLAVADWMYQNLRGLSRGEIKECQDVGKVDWKVINALLHTVRLGQFKGESYYDYGEREDSYLPVLVRYLHRFTEYIHEAGRTKEEKTILGIYKVAVCPYQRNGETECGRVFVGKDWHQMACQDHARKWRLLRAQRKFCARGCNAIRRSV